MKNKSLYAIILSLILCMLPSISIYASVNPIVITETEEATEELDVSIEEDETIDYIIVNISSVDDLIKLSNACRLDVWSKNKYVKLTDDIHLAGSSFEPITCFDGIFDGNGHTIDGFICNKNESYLGFVSKLFPNGTIKNLTLAGNVSPTGRQMIVGGLVGQNYGTIENCRYEGIVSGNDYVGAIAGFNESTGIITNCKSYGNVSGQHYTGGIVGSNSGGIYRSENNALINTTNEDKKNSISELNITDYVSGLLSLGSDSEESKSLDKANSVIDSGGIAGHSNGVIEYCKNMGDVGYEHVGYNVGGIVGRQSGYVNECQNSGTILGRKDVGGITGQAEPYLVLDLTEDIINQLTENINELHDLVDGTLRDSGDSGDVISSRLTVVKQFIDNALEDTSYLSGETINYLNGLTSSANEVLGRIDYSMDEAAKSGGAIDKSKAAMSDVKKASDDLDKAVKAADVESYMTEGEKAQYNQDKEEIANATEEYNGYYDKVYKNNYYFYLKDLCSSSEAEYVSKEYHNMVLVAKDSDGNLTSFPTIKNSTDECLVDTVLHNDDSAFPAEDEGQRAKDNELIADSAEKATDTSNDYAGDEFKKNHGENYTTYVSVRSKRMSELISRYSTQITGDASDNLKKAANNLKSASGNMESAASQTGTIIKDINAKDDITLPSLGDGYKAHTSSFVANLQGMSDNMGFLNEEMNSANDTLVSDMQGVNDSFNNVMLLFTDALDGALDGDYSDKFEDESFEVAEDSIEGTVANCSNDGNIRADINAAGIAGTMAIEYDFDLESEITGNKDSKLNSTYKSRCVLRGNRNDGRISSQKSYSGGITGLQEIGTILRSENYGRIASTAGDYVGGIAGESVSSIRECYSRGIYSGGKYIGGIAGYGHSIIDCYSLPVVKEAENYYGAIAGEVDDNYRLEGNFFCNDELSGIDRISYGGMAEPVPFYQFIRLPNAPEDMRLVSISFLIEDELVDRKILSYGETLKEDEYPMPISEEDYYVEWDTSLVHDVKGDMEIEGEQTRYLTTIAGMQLRGNNQSAILADGRYKIDQKLETVLMSQVPDSEKKVLECWKVTVPDDGAASHQIRLQPPTGVKKYEIKISTNGSEYVKLDTTEMGMYRLLTVDGNQFELIIIDKSLSKKLIFTLCIISFIILTIITIIICKAYRKKHPKLPKQKNAKKKDKKKLTPAEKRARFEEKVKEAVVEYIEDDGTARGSSVSSVEAEASNSSELTNDGNKE